MYNAVLVVYHNKSVDHLDLMHILDVIDRDIISYALHTMQIYLIASGMSRSVLWLMHII